MNVLCGAFILLVSTSLQGCRMRGFHANVHLRNPLRAPSNETNATNATNLTNTTVPKGPVGIDVDEHGCKTSAGFSWCEAEGSCLPPGQPCAGATGAAGAIPEGGSVGAGGVILDAGGQPLVGNDGKPMKVDPRIPDGGSVDAGGVILDAGGQPVVGNDGKPMRVSGAAGAAGAGTAGGAGAAGATEDAGLKGKSERSDEDEMVECDMADPLKDPGVHTMAQIPSACCDAFHEVHGLGPENTGELIKLFDEICVKLQCPKKVVANEEVTTLLNNACKQITSLLAQPDPAAVAKVPSFFMLAQPPRSRFSNIRRLQ